MIIKWINENTAWFFTNGNKQNRLEHIKERYGSYKLEEDENTVTITMSKGIFIYLSKLSKYGLDCFNHKSIPKWEPRIKSPRHISRFIESINYDAHRMGSEYAKTKNKINES